ncbi:MAG TPA: hypothetical protein VGW33_15275 [Terriglobia bacterium]|nr:hypothetical protein [Terriglobia bacterium]
MGHQLGHKILFSSLFVLICLPVAFFPQFPSSVASRLDEFGGDKLNRCPDGARGAFYVYKDQASHRWWFCDPAGNRFITNAVQDIDPYSGGGGDWWKYAVRRYGLTQVDYRLIGRELDRIRSIGFNTVGEDPSVLALPFRTSSGPGNPTKLPTLLMVHPSLGYKGIGCECPFHDTLSVTGPAFNGWRPAGFPDVWDPNWARRAYFADLTKQNMWFGPNVLKSFQELDHSPYYLGTVIEDSDQVLGFKGVQPDPANDAWFVAVDPPRQVWSGRFGVLYSDPVMHGKQEFADWLQGEADPTSVKSISRKGNTVTVTFERCGFAGVPPGPCSTTNYQPFGLSEVVNISGVREASFNGKGFKVVSQTADSIRYVQRGPELSSQGGTVTSGPGYTVDTLNMAWGAKYSTLGSSGAAVSGEVVGQGDGRTSSFTHELSHKPADAWSVVVTVNGKAEGGDCPWFDNAPWQFKNVYPNDCGKGLAAGTGVIQGLPERSDINSGAIDYRSGKVTINFRKPPKGGTTIAVSYYYDGWPRAVAHGTGFLDEDGTSPWMPSFATLRAAADHPEKQTRLEKDFDGFLNHLAQRYFSVLTGAVHAAVPHHLVLGPDFMGPYDLAPLLVQAGQYVDVLIMGETQDSKQFELPQHAYDLAQKPFMFSEFILGNPDSDTPRPCATTDRGNGCLPTQALRGKTYYKRWTTYFDSKGSDGYGFMVGWTWWGLFDSKTENENYGLETLRGNLYDGVEATTKNGEPADYGDFIGSVRAANLYWVKDRSK